jgi:RNA polymerase sigma factor (sigma-70 family)
MQRAWKVLVTQSAALHALLLRLTLRQDTADDLLHELLIRLSQSRAFAAAEDPAAYARRAAINLAMDWRRVRQRERRTATLESEPASRAPVIGATVEDMDEVTQILDAVQGLPELQCDAFVLRYVQQESFEQVGRVLGKTAHQARGLCHAAVKQVREKLAQKQVAHERT